MKHVMKKVVILGALSLFIGSGAAYACDGMKGHGDGQTHANKDKTKDGKARDGKKDNAGDTTKS
jgi:hypothetical protein